MYKLLIFLEWSRRKNWPLWRFEWSAVKQGSLFTFLLILIALAHAPDWCNIVHGFFFFTFVRLLVIFGMCIVVGIIFIREFPCFRRNCNWMWVVKSSCLKQGYLYVGLFQSFVIKDYVLRFRTAIWTRCKLQWWWGK